MLKLVTIFLSCVFTSIPSWAYLTILESGEPLTKSELHLGFAPQFMLDDHTGSNGVINIRTGLDEGRDFSVQLGGGNIHFWTSLSTRWIPIPDYDDQPAIGFRFDVTLSKIASESDGAIRVAPFASKRFRSDTGHIEPYVYLPIGLRVSGGTYDNLSSFVVGSQFMIEDLRPVFFYGETAFNIKNSVSYFTIGIFSTFDR